ncbi:AAA family ATPase [Brasilonema sp. CT11]|nr:AAA family ATPase [Brasilonema sp. CT11]
MKIESITLKGFRCFGNTPTTVKLSRGITAFVGANGSGKTALLEALVRVFGITNKQRTISRNDFYVSPNITNEHISTHDLYIDIRLSFPDLEEDSDSTQANPAIPACFHHMQVDRLNGTPFVRIRLEAKWEDDGTIDGNIEQKLWWIRTANESPTDEEKRPCEASERGLIQVHYIPATRDPSSQLTSAAGAILGRLQKAIVLSTETQQSIQTASQQIREVFGKEQAIVSINQILVSRWKELHDDAFDAEPELNVASRQFEDIIRRLNVVFRPTELNAERELNALSDGQKSLFYFSLIASVFEVEQKFLYSTIIPNSKTIKNYDISKNNDTQNLEELPRTGFNSNRLQTPALIIFAFEEPENHLAPYFLSRIITQLRSLVNQYSVQAVLTSHSPAILGRIKPEEVRHLRLIQNSRTVVVNEIKFSNNDESKYKYLREAVNAYPELYFARFVILGEGDSEQVVLPKLASALGLEVDPAFVAIVPLGGRHVNYFWKLLNELDIPHATLLDLDYGRKGAGWGRIKYALKQLLEVGVASENLLKFRDSSGNEQEISKDELEILDKRQEQIDENLIRHLENFGVFLSSPLDLDMGMLSSFADVYKAIVPESCGPRIPNRENSKYSSYLDTATKAVLGDDADSSVYPEEIMALFPWYRYLFLTKSKPSTHLQALCQIADQELANKAPLVLKNILKYTINKLR